jgi:hypothetical protein
MKERFFAFFFGVLCVESSLGQGTVNFSNLVIVDGVRIVDAPVFVCGSVRASGGTFVAELLAGPSGGSLAPVGLPAPFLSGTEAGYFSGGTRTINNVLPGQVATIQVRAWNTDSGATWDAAFLRGSFSMQIPSGGFNGAPPANLIFLQSICMCISCVPEPSTWLLISLGGLALFCCRRRRKSFSNRHNRQRSYTNLS